MRGFARSTDRDVTVYRLKCGCGFWTSSMDRERMKAAMLDHVDTAHREVDLPAAEPVPDTESPT